jgi:thymidine phosphorylase
MHAKPGARVRAGEPIFTLCTDEPDRFERARAALDGAYEIAPATSRPADRPLVIDRIDYSSIG